MGDDYYMGNPLIYNKCLIYVKKLFIQTYTISSMCQARAWDGEKKHCPQEAGKLSHPQITTKQWGDHSSSTKTSPALGQRYTGVMVKRGLGEACTEETFQLDLGHSHHTQASIQKSQRFSERGAEILEVPETSSGCL